MDGAASTGKGPRGAGAPAWTNARAPCTSWNRLRPNMVQKCASDKVRPPSPCGRFGTARPVRRGADAQVPRAGAAEAAATIAESPANPAGLHHQGRCAQTGRARTRRAPMPRLQSAQADFAPFPRRIHSLLGRTPPDPAGPRRGGSLLEAGRRSLSPCVTPSAPRAGATAPTPRPRPRRRCGRTAARAGARTGRRGAAARDGCRARGSRRGAAPGSGPRSGRWTGGAR